MNLEEYEVKMIYPKVGYSEGSLMYKGEHLKDVYHKIRLAESIGLLDWIYHIEQINGVYKRLGIPKQIKTTIFYKALGAFVSKKRFTNKELKTYLKESKHCYTFKETMDILCTQPLTFNRTLECYLMGLPITNNNHEYWDDWYTEWIVGYYIGDISLKDLLKEIKQQKV